LPLVMPRLLMPLSLRYTSVVSLFGLLSVLNTCRHYLGLTWDNVFISDEDIACDNARIRMDKQVIRVDKSALEEIEKKNKILYEFPPVLKRETRTVVVLAKPKTESSERIMWVPRTLAFILRDWKKNQDKLKECLGSDYYDYNLVVALEDGRPCESKVIQKSFQRLIEKNNLPKVVFHSLRHPYVKHKTKSFLRNSRVFKADFCAPSHSLCTEVFHFPDNINLISGVNIHTFNQCVSHGGI